MRTTFYFLPACNQIFFYRIIKQVERIIVRSTKYNIKVLFILLVAFFRGLAVLSDDRTTQPPPLHVHVQAGNHCQVSFNFYSFFPLTLSPYSVLRRQYVSVVIIIIIFSTPPDYGRTVAIVATGRPDTFTPALCSGKNKKKKNLYRYLVRPPAVPTVEVSAVDRVP